MQRWQVGDVLITKILEAEGAAGLAMFPDATAEKILQVPWLLPDFADATGEIKGSIHALVIHARGRRIIVDTCCGNGKDRAASFPPAHMLQTRFLAGLEAAGYRPDEIDTVLCTHLHFDHVGWNTMCVDGRWVPTFPNARYLFAREEFASWMERRGGFDEAVYGDSVHPVVEAGLVELVEPDHSICEEVSLIPTPGHTLGHVSVRISSRREQALITGDFMHNPCQIAWPEWSTVFDDDPAQARETRTRLLSELVGTPVLVIGTHFPTPTAGRIAPDGARYRLDCDAGLPVEPSRLSSSDDNQQI